MENKADSQEQTTSTIIVNPQDLNNLNANIASSTNNTDIHEDNHNYEKSKTDKSYHSETILNFSHNSSGIINSSC
jgi:hypothetical protein